MPVRCVIYDCDGVLFDSLEANRRLYNHIALSMGRTPLTSEELRYCHMNTVGDSIHCLFREDPETEAKASDVLEGAGRLQRLHPLPDYGAPPAGDPVGFARKADHDRNKHEQDDLHAAHYGKVPLAALF